MQNRPRFTGTLILCTLIHYGLLFLTMMLLSLFSLSRVPFQSEGLILVCYIYLPFALSGCVIGLHPHLIRPVLGTLLSASLVFVLSYIERPLLVAPAILLSTFAAFLTQRYKIESQRSAPLKQYVNERANGTAGQRDEKAEHD